MASNCFVQNTANMAVNVVPSFMARFLLYFVYKGLYAFGDTSRRAIAQY